MRTSFNPWLSLDSRNEKIRVFSPGIFLKKSHKIPHMTLITLNSKFSNDTEKILRIYGETLWLENCISSNANNLNLIITSFKLQFAINTKCTQQYTHYGIALHWGIIRKESWTICIIFFSHMPHWRCLREMIFLQF